MKNKFWKYAYMGVAILAIIMSMILWYHNSPIRSMICLIVACMNGNFYITELKEEKDSK